MNTRDQKGQRGRFAGLFLAQIFFIFLTPFVNSSGGAVIFLYLGVFSILVAGLYAASRNPAELKIALVILVPVLFAWLGPDLFTPTVDATLRFLTPAVSYAFTAVIVIRDVYRHQQVTTDTILGAVNVYLLIAFAFMFLHAAVLELEPSAYTIAGEPLADFFDSHPGSRNFSTLLYFSYTTLTTLGYGDILPVTPFAQLLSSGESALGQLFVAIIIGRLVGLEVSARAERASSPA